MSSIARDLRATAERSLSVALETNGKGYHGFIVELPGAFVRGPTQKETIAKTLMEARSYLGWLGENPARLPNARVVQTHKCSLLVEDADCEILLSDDRHPIGREEFRRLVELAEYSGRTFNRLYDSAELPDWVDEARVRTTFYGENKKTIGEIYDHVKRTQYYYLSRTGIQVTPSEAESFMQIRDLSFDKLNNIFSNKGNSMIHIDSEDWTLKKILRRFIWHDRIHGKAITRILENQRRLGLIDHYEDPFRFGRLDRSLTAPVGGP